ncbi:hypothetical protein DPEC_G00173770 [Dallia pectoralis]|uniref:Uncharacterized protein n=1 Tax=Dallia pectoralis TaxID=75939 RepID=A0ACC2GDP8_DALPE|nr:hypothetical protein DPEC_G00173770 [Dallia pectoralis]
MDGTRWSLFETFSGDEHSPLSHRPTNEDTPMQEEICKCVDKLERRRDQNTCRKSSCKLPSGSLRPNDPGVTFLRHSCDVPLSGAALPLFIQLVIRTQVEGRPGAEPRSITPLSLLDGGMDEEGEPGSALTDDRLFIDHMEDKRR